MPRTFLSSGAKFERLSAPKSSFSTKNNILRPPKKSNIHKIEGKPLGRPLGAGPKLGRWGDPKMIISDQNVLVRGPLKMAQNAQNKRKSLGRLVGLEPKSDGLRVAKFSLLTKNGHFRAVENVQKGEKIENA